MKYLGILNWVLFFFNAMMGVVLAVVSLMIGIYHEAATARGTELEPILVSTLLFLVAAVLAGLCVWAGRRRHWSLWVAEAALLLWFGLLYVFFSNLGN